MKPVTIVLPICCLDQELFQATDDCLSKIGKYTDHSLFDLLVIENGSQQFQPISHPEVETGYVCYCNPLGAARPFNMGVAMARTQYVVFMSNDVYVTPGWLDGLLTAQKADPWRAVVAPEESIGQPDWTPDSHWGACFLVERKLWLDLGGWDEVNFPWRYCDQDLSIRATQRGYEIGRTGLSIVEHKNMLTVNKMQGIIAPHAERERARMIEMYGASEFGEWLEKRNG